MQSLIIGLVLAAVSGVTFIAYRHPDLYGREFGPKILYSALAILGFALVYTMGYDAAVQKLTPYMSKDDPAVQAVTGSHAIEDYVFLISISAAIYSGFLSWLADHMKKEIEGNKTKDDS